MSKARDLASQAPTPSTVSATELGYLDGVTSAVQTQIDSKLATTTASSTYEPVLPSQTGNSGKYLTTNGTAKSWGTVSQYALPSQTGNAGKFLTTNGTAESWGTPTSGTWTQIATGSISGSSVSVTGLTGRTLYIMYSGLSGDASMANSRIQFNGDTAGNYSYAESYVNTTSPGSSSNYISLVASMTASQLYSGGFFIYFADTSLPMKPLIGIDSAGGVFTNGFYRSTSAITSVRFHGNAGNFDAGTYYIWSMS